MFLLCCISAFLVVEYGSSEESVLSTRGAQVPVPCPLKWELAPTQRLGGGRHVSEQRVASFDVQILWQLT